MIPSSVIRPALLILVASFAIGAPGLAQPDFVATKTNNTGGVGVVGTPFSWSITYTNIGSSVVIADENGLLIDSLPNTNMTYGSPSVGSLVGLSAGAVQCQLFSSNSNLFCSTNGTHTFGNGASFTVTIAATASAAGVYDNPRSGGACRADSDQLFSEPNESNNNCSDSVSVGTGVSGPDLTVVKNNNVGDATQVGAGAWTWSLQLANGGDANATFASGQTILSDNLPNANIAYGTPSLSGQSGISGSGSISCSIVSFNLTCTASGGSVTLAALSGAFTVSFSATPSAPGTFANPRSGGTCAVDPNGNVAEGDETNNACSNTVAVADSPDFIATKTNDVGGTATIGVPFTWSIEVSNVGGANAVVVDEVGVLFDALPTTNMTFGSPSVATTGLPSNAVQCQIFGSAVLSCVTNGTHTFQPGDGFTVSVSATASAVGTFDNPRSGGICRGESDSVIIESDETNNDCSDTVVVTTGVVGPDLSVAKTNNVGGTTQIGATPWTWSLAVGNGGTAAATFASGQVILRDNLPNANTAYGAPTVGGQIDVSGTGTIVCTIVASNLTCTASGGTVVLSAQTGAFTVDFSAAPSASGTFANPRGGGVCAVDPDGSIAEGDETNNACADSVAVANSPDFVATKTNDTSGIGEIGVPFIWSIAVTNSGAASVVVADMVDVLLDQLPTAGLTYGTPNLVTSGLPSSAVQCQILGTSLSCLTNGTHTFEPGDGFTVSFTATPTTDGSFANPRSGGTCRADPFSFYIESDETNNNCSDTVTVPPPLPDLQVSKTNDRGGVSEVASSWNWSLAVSNGGGSEATFQSGETILSDNLPNAGIAYGAPSLSGLAGISGTGTIVCTIVTSNLVCTATGGTVILAGGTGAFTVSLSADPSSAGTFDNPRSGGACAVDPGGVVTEDSEVNNGCADSVSVAASPDLVVTKSNDVSGTVPVGTAFDWSIAVGNSGGVATFPIGAELLRDALPSSDFVYGTASITSSSGVTGSIVCTIVTSNLVCVANGGAATLADGGEFTVTFSATPLADGVFDNPRAAGVCAVDPGSVELETDEGNNGCSDSVTVTPLASLTLSKVDGPDPVAAGASLTYTLGVANAGPSAASGVMVYDVLPPNTTFDSVASDVGCSQPAGLVGLRVALDGTQVVPPSGSSATGLGVLVLDTGTNELRFGLTVSGMTDTVTGASLRLADGTLVHALFEGAPPTFDDSNTIAGTIQLSPGEAAALQVAGSHRIRIGTDADPAGALAGTPAVSGEAPVACDLGTIAASGNGSAQVVATVGADQAGASLDNVAIADATTDDPERVDLPAGALRGDAAGATTSVVAETDLSITKDDSVDPVTAGQNLTYTLTVTNNGPSNSTGATVSDPLPAGTSFASSPDGCTEAGGTVTCPIGALGVGANQAVQFTVDVGAGVTGNLSNTATVSANEMDPNGANDSDLETTAVQALADLALTKTDSPDPVIAGQSLTYTLTVTNNGPSASTGATVSDPLPAGTAFASSPDGCTEGGGTVTCPIGALGVGANQAVQFTVDVGSGVTGNLSNTATVAGNETDPTSANDSATATTTVLTQTDLSLIKTGAPDPVLAGQSLTYTLTVTNNGPSNSTGATVSDPLPAGTTFASSPDGCTEAGGTVTCAIAALTSGGNQVVQFIVDVGAGTVGPIVNTATVAANETDPNVANDSAMSSTVVSREADLQIVQAGAPDPVAAGNALAYTLNVTNAGPSDDLDTVTVTDVLPAGVTFTAAAGAGWTCGESAGTVTCNRAGLPVGAAPAIVVDVTVDAATTGMLTNTVSVSSPTLDPATGANDTDVTETTTVETEADLAIVKTDSVDPVPGTTFDYTLTVTNNGPSDARNVVATDVLPAGITFDTSATCTEAAGTVTCDYGTIVAGDTANQTFTVVIVPPPQPSVTNTATVTSDEPDPNLADNSDDEQTDFDTVPPTVGLLGSISDTGDGELEDCETANVGIHSLVITFDEPVRDPTGDTDPDDVTNPDNIQLVAAGPDRTFQTAICGGALGDDVLVPASSIAYDDVTFTATVDFGATIADDLYRFAVCNGVSDLAGNALDGNGDGTGGDDFVRGFRVDADNRFANGHFDCDLAGWTTTSTNPGEIVWNADDHEGSGNSGSAALANLTASTAFEVGQCADLAQPGSPHDLRAQFRLSAPVSALLGLSRICTFFNGPACAGTNLGTSADVVLAEDTLGIFLPVATVIMPPPGAQSASCSFLLSAPNGDGFDANLDFLSLTASSGLIFADGFESGDTSSWSDTVGLP